MGTLLRTSWKTIALLVGFVLLATPAKAIDVKVWIYESTLKDYAAALGSLNKTDEFCALSRCTSYTITVTNLGFEIKANREISITGDMKVTWWKFRPGFKINATAKVSYDASTRVLKLRTTHTAIKPCFTGNVCLPFSVSIGKTFSFDIPVKIARFDFGTSSGHHILRLSPQNVTVTTVINNERYIYIEGDALLW